MADIFKQISRANKDYGPGDLMTGKSASYRTVDIDPQVQKLMDDYVARASESPEQISQRMNAGVDTAGAQAFESPEQIQMASAGGLGGNDAHLKAIRNKYSQSAKSTIDRLQRKNELGSVLTKSSWLADASKIALAKQSVATENYKMLSQAYNQALQARAGVISSFLQVSGQAGGIAAGNQQRSRAPRVYNEPGNTAFNDNSQGFGNQSGMNPDWMEA